MRRRDSDGRLFYDSWLACERSFKEEELFQGDLFALFPDHIVAKERSVQSTVLLQDGKPFFQKFSCDDPALVLVKLSETASQLLGIFCRFPSQFLDLIVSLNNRYNQVHQTLRLVASFLHLCVPWVSHLHEVSLEVQCTQLLRSVEAEVPVDKL